MAAANKYINKLGDSIKHEEQLKLSASEDYCRLAEFKNEDYHVKAFWHGRVDPNASQAYWTPYAFAAKVKVGENWVADPFTSQSCKTQDEAMALYKEYLVNYTDCDYKSEISGHKSFYEVGNELAPPPPPDPDVPHISEATNSFAGSW
jgi:hypothetical protein